MSLHTSFEVPPEASSEPSSSSFTDAMHARCAQLEHRHNKMHNEHHELPRQHKDVRGEYAGLMDKYGSLEDREEQLEMLEQFHRSFGQLVEERKQLRVESERLRLGNGYLRNVYRADEDQFERFHEAVIKQVDIIAGFPRTIVELGGSEREQDLAMWLSRAKIGRFGRRVNFTRDSKKSWYDRVGSLYLILLIA